MGLAAADGADVGRPGLEGCRQRRLVDLGVVGEQHDVGRVIDFQLCERFVGPGGRQHFVGPRYQHLIGPGESLTVGEFLPGIDHDHAKAQFFAKAGQGYGHVHAAGNDQQRGRQEGLDVHARAGRWLDDAAPVGPGGQHPGRLGGGGPGVRAQHRTVRGDQRRDPGVLPLDKGHQGDRLPPRHPLAKGGGDLRLERLDEHVDGAAAGQAHVPDHVLGDAKMQDTGRTALQQVDHLLVHGRLHAAAADRSGHPPAGGDDQARPHRPGRRALDTDHGRHSHLFTCSEPLLNCIQKLYHHTASPACGARVPARCPALNHSCTVSNTSIMMLARHAYVTQVSSRSPPRRLIWRKVAPCPTENRTRSMSSTRVALRAFTPASNRTGDSGVLGPSNRT